jgi:ABC-type polysaccharide/polyol phosphate export permease
VIARALFYASPILYPLERVPAQFQEIVAGLWLFVGQAQRTAELL